MITATVEGDLFILDAPPLLKDLVRQIPGMRWHRPSETWRAPLSWATALAARGVLSDKLQLDEAAITWGLYTAERVRGSIDIQHLPWPAKEYGHQDIGAQWLRFVEQGVLGDEPGLGKTRQALMALEAPALVISTNSMKFKWAAEIRRWRPDLVPVLIDGSAAKRTKLIESIPSNGIGIINWQALRTLSRLSPYGSIALSDKEKTPGPLNRPWETVVTDEAHYMKDPKSKQTRAAWAILATSRRRYGLTATISPEGPADLWGVMHGIAPEEYPSRTQFIDRYVVCSVSFWGGLETYGLRKDTKDEFLGFFDYRYLRRTKKEALPFLPDKTYTTRYVELPVTQRKAYNDLEKKYMAIVEGGILATPGALPQHTRLIQAASATPTLGDGGEVGLTGPSCKIDALLDLLAEGDDPIVVFSPSRRLIELASVALTREGIIHGLITGNRTLDERQKDVDLFQSGALRAILCTTKAGGEGLDMTRASRLVFLNRPERAVESVQAEDRVHRIGQDKPVEIIDIVAWDTVEHLVHERLGVKGDLAQEIQRDPNYVVRLIENRPKSVGRSR